MNKNKRLATLLNLDSVLLVESSLPYTPVGAKKKLTTDLKTLVIQMRQKRKNLSIKRIFDTLSQFKEFPFKSYPGFLTAYKNRNKPVKSPQMLRLPANLVKALKADSSLF